MQAKEKRGRRLILLIKFFLGIFVLEWIAFAILATMNRIPSLEMTSGLIFILTVLMLGNAAIFGVCAWGFEKKGFATFTLVWLVINIILTFTDEFGFYDLVNLIINLLALLLVIYFIVIRQKQLKNM